jgi:hypothetical protein
MTVEEKYQGRIFDFGDPDACTYSAICECGRKIEVSAQKDHFSEYITDVFVRCICGKSVHFELPVN